MRRLAPPALLALTVALILAACSGTGRPRIVRFDASASSITAGGSVTLSWTVEAGGPVSIAIDQGIGDVTGRSSVTVSPTVTTTYTLTASGAGGATTQRATVTVETAPTGTQSPTVTIQTPPDGSTTTSSVSVNGTAIDDVGVTSVGFRLNGGATQPCVGTSSFSCDVTGLTPGSNGIVVRATDAAGNAGSDSVSVTYATSSADSYQIDLHFVSSISSTQRAAFDAAATRWGQVISQGLPDASVSIPKGTCGYVPNSTTVSLPDSTIAGTIDDLRIDVWVGAIDGTGGILGEGGPCLVRSSDYLTVYGVMMFDAADLAYLEQNNLLQTTILHEMGHVLGIGTLWDSGRSLLAGAGTDDPRFVGAAAVDAWHALGGSGSVPVENCIDASGRTILDCGSGTRDGHWREAVFGNELMTGWLNPGSDPLSRVTIGSLQDLGYAVDLGQADPYSLPGALATQSLSRVNVGTFLLVSPKGETP